jgi:cell division GTPase FtsZ
MQGVTSQLDPDARVIFGARMDDKFEGSIRLMAVVTGIADLAGDYKGLEVTGDVSEMLSRYST